MQNPLTALRHWWNRPPAKQRILDALSTTVWRRGYDVREAAGISNIGRFYNLMADLEAAGHVRSQPEAGPIPAERGGRRGRIYRKI